MVIAIVFASIGLCIGGFALVVLAHTNESLVSRLSCRAQASDRVQAAEARALVAVADNNFTLVGLQARQMLQYTDDLEEC